MTIEGLSFLTERPRPALIGMIHVGALPGTPRASRSVRELIAAAVDEARMLVDGGVNAILLENMHDVPYLKTRVGPEIVAALTAVCAAVRGCVSLPLGVQVLAGANRQALAVAHAAGCEFIRCEGFVFAHVADEGLMPDADAGRLLRYRRRIGAEAVAVVADIKKKHSAHAITADVDLKETARAAEFFGADGVVVTGIATGRPTDPHDVQCVTEAVDLPVAIGSGLTPEDLARYWPIADLFIVGSFVKQDGVWSNPIDAGRLGAF
ncbi:MAG: BtpA/SgcQ family protein, partial [Phycisphaerae bacterium]